MVYLLMAMAALIMLLLTAPTYDRKDGLLARFVVANAVILTADWIAFGWFRLYDYFPGLLRDHVQDSALGEFLAELLFVPALVLFLDRFLPGIKGAAVGAALVSLIEVAVLRQGTFRQCGWSVWYTLAGFALYFTLLHEFWDAVRRGAVSSERVQALVRICALVVAIGLFTLFLRAFHLVHTNLHLMPTELGNQSLGRFLTYLLTVIPLGYWVASAHGSARWWRLAAVTGVLYAFNLLLWAIHFQQFKPPYSGLLDGLGQAAAILAGAFFADLIDPHCLIAESRIHRV